MNSPDSTRVPTTPCGLVSETRNLPIAMDPAVNPPNVEPSEFHRSHSPWLKLFFATLVIGVVSGFGGMFLALLLHFIQRLAYGYNINLFIDKVSFLQVVSTSSSSRRVTVLFICGLIAGFGWWSVYRYGKPLVSISKAIRCNKPQMPIGTTLVHVLLQIITVALGSPLGREVAPRELCATFACWFTEKIQLTAKESQVLVACAAGAGLAAVFNVPLGGAMLVLETLLRTFSWFALVPAIATSALAVTISWIGLGNQPIYYVPHITVDYSLVIWSILTGPIFGYCAYWFRHYTSIMHRSAPHNGLLIVLSVLNFLMIGLLAVYFPALLGNGKSLAQLGFDGNALGIGLAVILLILRILIVCTSLKAGASGGLLTPSLANGALMAVSLGIFWNWFWPGTPITAYCIIGAAAFLASSQKMPMTAVILIVEFTDINFSFLIPILFAVSCSLGMFYFCSNKLQNN